MCVCVSTDESGTARGCVCVCGARYSPPPSLPVCIQQSLSQSIHIIQFHVRHCTALCTCMCVCMCHALGVFQGGGFTKGPASCTDTMRTMHI